MFSHQGPLHWQRLDRGRPADKIFAVRWVTFRQHQLFCIIISVFTPSYL